MLVQRITSLETIYAPPTKIDKVIYVHTTYVCNNNNQKRGHQLKCLYGRSSVEGSWEGFEKEGGKRRGDDIILFQLRTYFKNKTWP